MLNVLEWSGQPPKSNIILGTITGNQQKYNVSETYHIKLSCFTKLNMNIIMLNSLGFIKQLLPAYFKTF